MPGPIKQKDLKTYPVKDYPYTILSSGTPTKKFYRSMKDARQAIIDDIEALSEAGARRLDIARREACADAISRVGMLEPGETMRAVVDPKSGFRGRWMILKRDQV